MNTDDIMVDTWLSLARDFRLDDNTLCARQEQALRNGIQQFRKESFPGRMQCDPHLHKRIYQLETLFKRYSFQHDEYTKEQLETKANEDFMAFQAELSAPRKPLSIRARLVVQNARRIVRRILGKYDAEQHMQLCQFGKRAAVGVTAQAAFLDNKVSCLSGSSAHNQLFEQLYTPFDRSLKEVHLHMQEIARGRDIIKYPTEVDCLTLVNVPKKYNTLRSIIPNTVLGGFFSLGLGKYIERCLRENENMDIRKLQEFHKILARQSSTTRHLVTLDLRKASENYQAWLVNMLCPRDWYNALKLGRIKYAMVGTRKCYLQSFMAMGIGYTFPLQTLFFYAILKSIAELLEIKGRISVYGDDCIYPRKMHSYVLHIFADLGFKPNTDKTFSDHFFRESCGGDYYRGVDVRPYSPEGNSSDLKGVRLEVFCYKLINGLLRRWDVAEIPRTYHYLLSLIASKFGRVLQVPPSFPDSAGVRVGQIQNTWFIPWSPVFYSPHKGNHSFIHLHRNPDDRPVRACYPYYWNALRQASLAEPQEWTPWDEAPQEIIRWVKTYPKVYVRSRITRERILRRIAVVPSKVMLRYGTTKSYTSLGSWCETQDVS